MLIKAIPTAHTTPYASSNYFVDHKDFPFSAGYRDETYTGRNNLTNSCASLTAYDYGRETDIAFHGFDVSELPSKCLLNKVTFNFQVEAWDASNQWTKVSDSFFTIICGNKEIFKGSFMNGPYSLEITTWDNRRTFSIDITDLVDIEGLRDLKFRIYINKAYGFDPICKFMGASLNIDYTPIIETVLVPHSFTPSFKCPTAPAANGTPGTTIADNLCVGGIKLREDGVRDGQFYDFNCPAYMRFCQIRKAYVTFKVYVGIHTEDASYGVYVGNNRLEMIHPETIENEYHIYTIDLPNLSYEWMKDLKFICQGTANHSGTVPLTFYGVELHILHEEPVYRGQIATGHATNYFNPEEIRDDEDCGFSDLYNITRAYREPASQSNYAELDCLHSTRANIYFIDFNFVPVEGVELDKAIIDRVDMRVQEYWYYIYKAPVSYYLYLGDTALKEFTYEVPTAKTYYMRHMVVDGLNLTAADLPNLKLRFKFRNISTGQLASAGIVGSAIDLWAGAGVPEPELPSIVETIVKGDYSKAPELLFPSENVQPNEVPDTEGYIGNLYNDDLDDYAEFKYDSTNAPAEPKPGDRPYESIIIMSPTLESLGIPQDANITRVNLTEEGYIYSPDGNAKAEIGLYVDGHCYGSQPFVNSSSFSTTTFDTGEISYPRLDIDGDVLTFQIRWYSLDSDFVYRVKYLLWDITYEVGRFSYIVRFNQQCIDKMKVGNEDAQAAYIGNFKIYG